MTRNPMTKTLHQLHLLEMTHPSVTFTLGVIKLAIHIYDVITFPVYALLQRPWRQHHRLAAKAHPQDPNDPYSPWVRVGHAPDNLWCRAETIGQLFDMTCRKNPEKKSFGYRESFDEEVIEANGVRMKKYNLGQYKWITCGQMDKRVENVAKGLTIHGVRAGDVVLIVADTRLEWMISAQAIFRLGGTIATVFTNAGEDAIIHAINETEATHIVTIPDLVPKLRSFSSQTPKIKTVICIDGNKPLDVHQFEQFQIVPFNVLEQNGHDEKGVNFNSTQIKSSDPAVIMYTSGSTGAPKGVILTHKSILSSIYGFLPIAESLEDLDQPTYIAYLPLAHVFELIAELLLLYTGHAIGYSSPQTITNKSIGIKEGQLGDILLLKPTIMLSVPLILDRIRKGVMDEVDAKGPLFKSIFLFLLEYKNTWAARGYHTPIINALVCSKIRNMLGGRVRYIISGSAPLSPDTMQFIRASFNVTVIQGYGLTETTSAATIMEFNDLTTGRVGSPLDGSKIKLVDWNEGNYLVSDKPNPRGELVVSGGSVAMGYYKNPSLTSSCFIEDNGERWFYTGDIGEIYPDGSIKIVDRKKDIVKLQNGEYVSLGKVESVLMSCPLVENICVYASSLHNYVIAIVKTQKGALDKLVPITGLETSNPRVLETVRQSIREHGLKAKLQKFELPHKILLTSEEWTPQSGLVTANNKIRRRNITDHYIQMIDYLYSNAEVAMSI